MRRREFLGLVGGGVAWPAVARAQQQTVPTIGFLSSRSPEGIRSHISKVFCAGWELSDTSMARPRRSNIAGPTDSMIN